jgi:hypothetical protein
MYSTGGPPGAYTRAGKSCLLTCRSDATVKAVVRRPVRTYTVSPRLSR